VLWGSSFDIAGIEGVAELADDAFVLGHRAIKASPTSAISAATLSS
jgi:hypothetical protein